VRNSQVPVIETESGTATCIDAGADQQMALDILINAKTTTVGVQR
jgi:gamma-glutamyl phosphate reductase